MTEQSLRNCAILVVEDEYLLADDLCGKLIESEAIVIGPAATVEEGRALLRQTEVLNGAVLDVNLRGEPVSPSPMNWRFVMSRSCSPQDMMPRPSPSVFMMCRDVKSRCKCRGSLQRYGGWRIAELGAIVHVGRGRSLIIWLDDPLHPC